ncbi:MAG: methyltransferase domain-containing protein [Planctomycetota bacterium]
MPPQDQALMQEWVNDVEYERHGPVRRLLKAALFNPFANYFPAGWMRKLLKLTESELAAANWKDPGGWRSMVISYEGNPKQFADKVLVGAGSVPTALRNRRRLSTKLLASLIDHVDSDNPHVLCLAAGPGITVIDALSKAAKPARATLVDISPDAFDYGCTLAAEKGVVDRVRYVLGDVRDIHELLDTPPDIVTMIGICEYLTDQMIYEIAEAAAGVMPRGTAILFNSIANAHGTDRFFRRVFGLHLNHRSVEHLQGLAGQAGFGQFSAFPEPLGVYNVIVGRRL